MNQIKLSKKIENFGSYGPLDILRMEGEKFENGDIIYLNKDLYVLARVVQYNGPTLGADVDDGTEDAPYRMELKKKEMYIILRAHK
jgi:hypothetical protein